MATQVGPGSAKPEWLQELRVRERNEVRVSGIHSGPQWKDRLQQGRI
jgi:hypothetical protein